MRVILRTVPTLAALAAAAAVLSGQGQPKLDFVQAVGQFSLALEGAYGDEGARLRSSLEAMSRSLAGWDAGLKSVEAAMAADRRTAEPALALRMHLALAGLYFDRARTAEGLRELGAARTLDDTRAALPLFEAVAQGQLAGNEPAAATALRRAATLNPDDPIVAYLLARSLSRTGSTEGAAQQYQRFTAQAARAAAPGQPPDPEPFTDLRLFHETPGVEPFFPPVLFADGFAELERGNLARAIDAFRLAVTRDPLLTGGVESGALARAATAFRDGSLETAAEHLAVAIELAPDHAEPHRILGLLHGAGRRPDAAIEALAAAIRLNPRDERARLALADTLIAGDRLPAAREALQDTLTMYPASGRARYKLGIVLQRQGLYAEASRELTTAAAQKPLLGLNSVYQTLGALARGQQQYDAAIAAFSRRVDLVPNDADAHHELGEMYFRVSRHAEALAEFTLTVMLNPNRTDAHAAIGQVHLRTGRYADAAAAARRAIALDGLHKEARYVLATSLVRLGNVDDGKRELEVYQRLQTEATAAQSRRLEIEGLRRDASVSIVNGDHAKAVELLRRVLERDPESADAPLDFGIALLKGGRAAEAVEQLTAAAARQDSEDAHLYLAEAYAALGRGTDAERERAIAVRMRQDVLRRAGAAR